ncbi:beta-eliminating lyase-related protein [Hyphomicrobium sp. CS1BSMeth3]|uniref:threonine aldolase family protein n=1 Tax=Hyphomicrobium sp. CS1BSMeth3 TaxID=1892844 RepID=UPI000930DC48|nr:beta-eliminating lyase-related protein [Hyphomicrobium sp. CS1BSMeth3]
MSAVLKHACAKHLSYDLPVRAADVLRGLADYAGDALVETLGHGAWADQLAERVRSLLGCEAAVFMPSGKTAQNIAFKLWCERRGFHAIAVHPRSHVEQWEGKAYAHVFGLNAVAFGDYDRQTSPSDIDTLPTQLGVASIELALRPLGCPVIPWSDLTSISQRLRTLGVPFHGDCARIWEAQPHLDRPLPDIAKLFDSLYVSLYKGLGGLAGAVLLGPADLISEAKTWQRRLGQRLPGEFPFHLAALKGLEERLSLMPAFRTKARDLAKAITRIDGLRVTPDPPHTNAFQVILGGRREKMAAARDEVARRMGLWLYELTPPNPVDGLVTFEVHVRTAALKLEESEVAEAIAMFKSLIR